MSEELSLEEISIDTEDRMNKTVKAYEKELSRVRTGRARTSLVDSIKVDYFNVATPMNQLANISVPDASTILIQPWDPNVISDIEKAISQSDLGITPANDGKLIRLSIPPLTEERRKELVKYVGKITEDHKISVRQIRKESNNQIKDAEKSQKLPEDDVKKVLSDIQDLTDNFIEKLESIMKRKEKEILEI